MAATISWVNVLSYDGARSGPADSGRSICGTTEISLSVVFDLCAFGYTRRGHVDLCTDVGFADTAVPSFLLDISELVDQQLPPETVDKRCS
jgi:hypothetical protein